MRKQTWNIPVWKRAFDILVATFLLILLSPLLLLVTLFIKIESKGPIFYTSKRVGQGFKVFDFYKFRSMRADASAMLQQIKHLNQYQKADILIQVEYNPTPLIKDNEHISESAYQLAQAKKKGQVFIKIKNDPRITRVGQFIRSTSIDELPQLWNVIKGDMSLVGNRPLPLYEAEQLTTDESILRFKAPAGITGLWQVEGRGKKEVSEQERKQFDLTYSQKYNWLMDLKILAKTLPAAVQEVNV